MAAFYAGLQGLLWGNLVAGYAMWVMMTYLTDVWEMNFTHAAGIVSLWQGFVFTLQFFFAFLADTVLGYCPMLVISSIFYSIGMGLLSLSTPPLTGTCKEYKPECIGQTQRIMLYIALANIAVGFSGQSVALTPFFRFQVYCNSPVRDYSGRANAFEFATGISIIIGPLTGALLPIYVKERCSLLFGIPTILYLLGTILFLIGIRWYHSMDEPEGSPLTKVLRVLTASVLKIFHKLPNEHTQLYEKDINSDLQKIPHTPQLRFLDKAAILIPGRSRDEQEKDRWRLCGVTEVEETKIAIRIIPMAIAFIICGLVSCIGNTYFVEQANNMNRKVGKFKVPILFLLIIFEISKFIFIGLYVCLITCLMKAGKRKYAPPIGIAVAMIFSILCCVIAAKVEIRRLNVIRNHGLLDKPKDRIPMSMFWLVPQFFLLAGLSTFFELSFMDFFFDQIPKSLRSYLSYFNGLIFGFGTMASVLSVHLAGKISENGGKRSWFQDTLNKSRLDEYYWLLAALSAANLVFYVFVAIFYPYKEPTGLDVESEEVTSFRGFPVGMPVVY